MDNSMLARSTITPYTVNMEQSFAIFDKHVSDANLDFKEEIHRKV